MSAYLREAEELYASLGWTTIPVRHKKPRVRKWRPAPPRETLARFWDDPETTGLAVVLGAPSGNLVVRDFDRLENYERWQAENPELARRLPTAETPRPGRHVFARTAGQART